MTTVEAVNRQSPATMRALLRALPASHQPAWRDGDIRDEMCALLSKRDPLVTEPEVKQLRSSLAAVARGESVVLQAGDCDEPAGDTAADVVEHKAQAMDVLSECLGQQAQLPVVALGRIAGQYAKPRTDSHETVAGAALSTYRGSLVNSPDPFPQAREHDPGRLLSAHLAAGRIARQLRSRPGRRIWISHEALILDYELPQLRGTDDGRPLLTSAHSVWIGARTNQWDHAHVALAAAIVNPVGCKVSAVTSPQDLVVVANAIDPDRVPGKVMFISRMGAAVHRLPALMAAVRREGHEPIWLCDPMHANTRPGPDGRKTRYLDDIVAELVGFRRAARTAGVVAGGVHLETTIDDVRECLVSAQDVRGVDEPFTSLCDPRLTVSQAATVLAHWTREVT